MTHDEQFREAIRKLNEFRLTNRSLIEEMNASMRVISELKLNLVIPKVMEDFARINSLQAKLSNLKLSINSPMLNFAREASLSISKIAISPQLVELAKQAASVSQLWKDQFEPFKSAITSIEASQLAFQSEFAKVSELSMLAQRSLAQIRFEEIGKALKLTETARDAFGQVQYDFSKSYSHLFKSLELETQRITLLPPVVSFLPPVEFYTGSRVLRLFTESEIEVDPEETTLLGELTNETNGIVVRHLGSLNPALIKLWQGANEALRSRNPDAVRHFITSLRELLTHVIHTLSPDEDVRRWSALPEHYHNDKPTRRARLLFICHEVNYEPFNEFLKKDIDSVLACFDLFQQSTHEIQSSLSQAQLEAIKLRTESAIRFLIDIGKKTSGA